MTRTNSDYHTTRPPVNILGELKEGYELVEESTWRGKRYYIKRREPEFPTFFIYVIILVLLFWFFSAVNNKQNTAQKTDNTTQTEKKYIR